MKIASLVVLIALGLCTGCTEKLHNEIAGLRQSLDTANGKLSDASAAVAKLTAENEGLRARVEDVKAAADKAAAVAAAAATEKEAAWKKREAELQADATQLKQTVARLEAEVQALKASAERVSRENDRGELVGAVSYYFNANYGDKPDSGSEVFVFRPEDQPGFDAQRFKRYLIRRMAIGAGRPDPAPGVSIKDEAEQILKITMPIEVDKKTIRLAADGAGSFRMKLKPGRYAVLIRSAHRDAMTILEVSGQMSCHEIDVVAGDQTNVSAKFYP